MSIFKTEAEQVDDLKRWIKSYGPSVLAGIVIAIGVIYGKQFWQSHQTQKAQEASVIYQAVIDAFEQKQWDTAKQQAELLKHDYPSSPYAEYASFLQAKIAVEAHDYPNAIQQLTWAVEHSPDEHLKALAELRLADVQIANHQPEVALSTLDAIQEKHYAGLTDLIRGDAYVVLGKQQEAKQAYLRAQQQIPDIDQLMPTLQIRIDNSETP